MKIFIRKVRNLHNERGQSSIMVALAMVVLVAFVALVVDSGNIYAQRRTVQNAVDSASYAGGQVLARPDPTTNTRATNLTVLLTVKAYLKANGIDTATLDAQAQAQGKTYKYAAYVIRDANNAKWVDCDVVTSHGPNIVAPAYIKISSSDASCQNNGKEGAVIGVQAYADKTFNSFFANIVGIKNFNVASNNPGLGAPIPVGTPTTTTNGTCCAQNLFPVTLPTTKFFDPVTGQSILQTEQSDPTHFEQIWTKDGSDIAGNWLYLNWDNQTNSNKTLQNNMDDALNPDTPAGDSGQINVGDYINAVTGARMNQFKQGWIDAIGHKVVIPVYDTTQNPHGNQTQYHVAAFAYFHVEGVCTFSGGSTQVYPAGFTGCTTQLHNNSDAYIVGQWNNWATNLCNGSCPYTGVGCTGNCGGTHIRTLQGTVYYALETQTTTTPPNAPVDVMHLLDVSGSMDYCVSTTNNCSDTDTRQKLYMAKQALTSFDSNLQPNNGDRAGLATFPLVTTTNPQTGQDLTNYNFSCQQSGTNYPNYFFGQNRMNLTSNITRTNGLNQTINGLSATGGTPLAGGINMAGGMLLSPSYHNQNNTPVLIIATDGIANVRINGQWTGFKGDTYDNLDCNDVAVQDAVKEANDLKAQDVLIYTIAIGTDFNSNALEQIASAPVSNHFFTVSNAQSMQSIYTAISQQLDQGTCKVKPIQTLANGATVTIYNQATGQSISTTTNDAGFYSFDNVKFPNFDPGTWQFTSVTITVNGKVYNVFTDGFRGPVLTTDPSEDIGAGDGQYTKNIFLNPAQELTCP